MKVNATNDKQNKQNKNKAKQKTKQKKLSVAKQVFYDSQCFNQDIE